MTDEGVRPPVTDEGVRPPVTDEGVRPPKTDEGVRPPNSLYLGMNRYLLSLAAALMIVVQAQAQFSPVTVQRISDCCFRVTVQNGDQLADALREFTFKIPTKGVTVVPASLKTPAAWTASMVGTNGVRFTSSTDSIAFGDGRTGFEFCVTAPGNVMQMDWIVANPITTVDVGALQLRCSDLCDTSSVSVQSGGCCPVFRLRNRNIQQLPITQVRYRIITAGSTIGTYAAATDWGVQAAASTEVLYTHMQGGLVPGDSSDGFTFCVQPIIGGPPITRVLWTTYNDSTELCSDTLEVVCQAGSICDAITLSAPAPGSCCPDIQIRNSNSALAPVTSFSAELLTPGAMISGTPTAPGGWRVRLTGQTLATYAAPAPGLQPGESVAGLGLCIEPAPGYTGFIRIRLATYSQGQMICQRIDSVRCTAAPRTPDSVAVFNTTPANPPANTCSYSLTLFNRHTPAGALDGLRLRIISPGVTFTGTPGGLWTITQPSATEILYTAPAPLASGASRSGLTFSTLMPAPMMIAIVWESLLGTTVVSTDTVVVNCATSGGSDDVFRMRLLGSCQYNAGFTHRRAGGVLVNGFTVRIVSPGVTFNGIPSPRSGWSIAQQGGTFVRFTSSPNPGAARDIPVDDFLMTFNPPVNGSAFLVALCTTVDNGFEQCDTVTLRCTVETVCDSLVQTSDSTGCAMMLDLVNTHTPASNVTGLRINITSPGVTLALAQPPAGWVIASSTPTLVVFRDTTSGIAPGAAARGFRIAFANATASPTVAYEWCSILNGQVLCCGTSSLTCDRTITKCDSLLITPWQNTCVFDMGFANVHEPAGAVTRYRVTMRTPGAVLVDALPPAGWTRASFSATEAVFENAIGTPPSMVADGFRVSVLPAAGTSGMSLGWCTEGSAGPICCDSTLLECEIGPAAPDTLRVIPDALQPCCYDMEVHNVHRPSGNITVFHMEVLSDSAEIFSGFPGAPTGWLKEVTARSITWRTSASVIAPSQSLRGFGACIDDFGSGRNIAIRWETRAGDQLVTADTLVVNCAGPVAVDGPAVPVRDIALGANFPNPFSASSTLAYELPREGMVRIELYDAHGRMLRVLASGMRSAGTHSLVLDARGLAEATYFVRLVAGGAARTRAIVVIR